MYYFAIFAHFFIKPCCTFLFITFFAQTLQSDKTHHRKAKKILYKTMYVVNLSKFILGYPFFGPNSTGLVTEGGSVASVTIVTEATSLF
jgi:hypothetical protein